MALKVKVAEAEMTALPDDDYDVAEKLLEDLNAWIEPERLAAHAAEYLAGDEAGKLCAETRHRILTAALLLRGNGDALELPT